MRATMKDYSYITSTISLSFPTQSYTVNYADVVPDNLSSTSIQKKLDIPRGQKMLPVPMNHVMVARPSEQRKRKPILCQVDTTIKLPRISKKDIQVLQSMKGTPFAYIVSPDVPKVHTPIGDVQLGSVLSYQMRNIKTAAISTSTGCGNTTFPKATPIKLPAEFMELNNGYDVHGEKNEALTRNQADCME